MFDRYINLIKEKAKAFFIKHGILAVIAAFLVPLKIAFFYTLIGIRSNFFLVWLITCILTYLLFASFKNKWIPACIYLVLTILMFADVTYSSFFNRYLSVNMLGAAGFLGDITESIKEVLRAKFFLLFTDVLAIFAALTAKRVKKKTSGRSVGDSCQRVESEEDLNLQSEEASAIEVAEEEGTASASIAAQEPEVLKEIYLEARRLAAENRTEEGTSIQGEEKALEELLEAYVQPEKVTEEADPDQDTISEVSLEEAALPTEEVSFQDKKALLKNKIYRFLHIIKQWVLNHKKQTVSVFILLVLVFNISGSYLITSISNQEVYSYHVKDILGVLTGNNAISASADIKYAMTDHYNKEKDGPLFGVAEGRNLIVIQLESFQNFVINATYNGQELTPNLNRLLRENTIYFDNYYQQVGSGNTSDAEFATNHSIYGSLASYTYKLYENNYFKGLPALLKEKGYETAVYHAYENRDFWNRENAYKSIGFDTFVGGIEGTDKDQYDMTEWMGWGLTDTEFYKQTVPYIKEMPEPFYSFVNSLSNHHPYVMLEHYRFIDLLPRDEGTVFGNYLMSVAYTDYALGQFFQQLKDEGIYDNSIIAIYGDHLGLPKNDEDIYKSMTAYMGKPYDFDTMMNIPLIITLPQGEKNIRQTVHTAGGQLDFLPTMAYLMGFESLDTLYLGHNLLTVEEGFVAEQTYMTKGSFFRDDIAYEMSRDGVFENGRAWNRHTGKEVPVEDYYEDYVRAMAIINESEYILKNDMVRKVFLDDGGAQAVLSENISISYPDQIAVAGAPSTELKGTNSLEALNASYEAGYRNIKVEVCWTEDREAILLKSYDQLGQLFNTDKKEVLYHEDFMNLEMKDNLTQMDYIDLIAWMKEHPDVTIIAKPERSADFFMKAMEGYAGSIFDRFIVEVPGPVEYSGLYNSILNIDGSKTTAEQLLDYIRKNNIKAISMSQAAAEGVYKKVLKADCIRYIEEVENGILTKRN